MKLIIFTYLCYFNVNVTNIIERNKNNILMHLFQVIPNAMNNDYHYLSENKK